MERERLENIIIGTLLESTADDNYYTDCRCCVTEDMFMDATNRRIYHYVSEMQAGCKSDTRPSDIFAEYGAEVVDIIQDMMDKVINYSFLYLKWLINEGSYLYQLNTGVKVRYTNVMFSEYVNAFVKMYFYEEKRNRKSVV